MVCHRRFSDKNFDAISSADDISLIKIGRITGTINSLTSQYSTRYHPEGYRILRYWYGSEYYGIETEVHNHPRLAPVRIRNSNTGKLTEWFRTTSNVVDDVVYEVICHHRNVFIPREQASTALHIADNKVHEITNNPEINTMMKGQVMNTSVQLSAKLSQHSSVIFSKDTNQKQIDTHDLSPIINSTSNLDINVINQHSLQVMISTGVENEMQLIQPDYINGDIYFNVKLTSSLQDGPIDYLGSSMISNFKHMFPPSRRASANVYAINNDEKWKS